MQIVAPPTEIIARALQACRKHFIAVAAFSALLNLLFLVPMLYMLQIYDRVIPTRGSVTLFFITLVLLFGLISLAMLDYVRSRVLVRASIRLAAVPAAFSGRGEIPHRRYLRFHSPQEPASALAGPCWQGVSRPGAKPGPTVTVRMKEIANPQHA